MRYIPLIRSILQSISFSSSLVATYFWIRANIWMSAETIASLAMTKYGYDSSQVKNFSGQRADSVVAFCLLTVGFTFQFILFFIPITIDSITSFGLVELIIILISLGSLLFLGRFISNKISVNLFNQSIVAPFV